MAPVGVTGEVCLSFRGNSLVTTAEVVAWLQTLDGITLDDKATYVAGT